MAVSGSTIIGATNEGTGTQYGGAGYEFTEPAGGWSGGLNQTAKLALTPGSGIGNFATGVGISGTTVVLGAYSASPPVSGAAYIFGPQGNDPLRWSRYCDQRSRDRVW